MDNTLKCELLLNQQVLAIILTIVTEMTLAVLCYRAGEDKIVLMRFCSFNDRGCLCFQIFFDRTVVRFSCFLYRMDHYTFGKTVDRVSCFVWSKLSSRHLTVPDRDRFLNIAVKCLERWKAHSH